MASATPGLAGYVNAVTEIVVSERSQGRVRLRAEPLARRPGTSPRITRTVGRDAELDWVAGGFGSERGKVWIQNDLAERGATSRVTGAYFADGTQHLDYDTYQLHAAPDTTRDFAFKGRSATLPRPCGAG